MATIVTINSGDLISNSRADLNTNFDNLNDDKIETSTLDTDTTLAANSDAKIATQKAVKAYVDAGGNVNASTTSKGIVEEATQAEVDAGTAVGSTGARLFINPSSTVGGSKTVKAGATINGATLPVPVYQNKTDNEFYACDANDTAAMKFLGFAVSNGTDGGDLAVKFTGIVSGFSGLDEGQKYYVSDTVGTIQNSPGTNEVLVGVAISPTELLIQKGQRYAKGSASTGEASGTSVVTTGFRPSKITIYGVHGDATLGPSVMQAIWTPAGIIGVGAGNAIAAISSPRLYDRAGGDYMEFSITDVTDTGFTVAWSENGSFSTAGVIVWEALGEL